MTAPYSLTVRGPSVVEEGANARSRPGLSGLRRSKKFTTENSENHGDARRFFEAAFIKSDQSTAFINDATQNNDATHGDYRLRSPIYRVGSSSCPRHPRAQPHTHRDKCRAEHDLRFVVILGLEPRIARITHHGRLSAPARVHGCSGRARAGRWGSFRPRRAAVLMRKGRQRIRKPVQSRYTPRTNRLLVHGSPARRNPAGWVRSRCNSAGRRRHRRASFR